MEFKLSNGVVIPGIGFGTWQIKPEDSYLATKNALLNGYRHIDTAYAYENEEGVGKAIKDSGLKREDVFVTTSIPPSQRAGTVQAGNRRKKAALSETK